MANLTGQQIQNTYPGLLNLATATAGITSSYQQIQDGLGNNTNTRISTSGIISPNLVGINNLKPDYAGPGFLTTGVAPVANTQNRVLYQLFYDPGVYSYSAITYNVNTLTSTSDVATIAFYSLQQVPLYGVAPKDLLMSGITLTTNSTGVKTTTLPSTLSFSGTGSGWYVMAIIISNAGNVTPTWRYTNAALGVSNQAYANTWGSYMNAAGTALNYGSRIVSYATITFLTLNNLSAFQTSFSQSDISTNLSTTTNSGMGFGLNTI
jgi:hypothetical protein